MVGFKFGKSCSNFAPFAKVCLPLNALKIVCALKILMILTPWAYVMQLFTVIVYEISQYARVFIICKLFRPSQMFAGMVGAT
jgi:hypothetical protein